MATTKTKDTELSDLASELGVSLDSLNSMDIAEIKKLMKSGDLDPAQKARLVKAKLSKLRDDMSDAIDLNNSILSDAADDEMAEDDDFKSTKGSKGSKSARADY